MTDPTQPGAGWTKDSTQLRYTSTRSRSDEECNAGDVHDDLRCVMIDRLPSATPMYGVTA